MKKKNLLIFFKLETQVMILSIVIFQCLCIQMEKFLNRTTSRFKGSCWTLLNELISINERK